MKMFQEERKLEENGGGKGEKWDTGDFKVLC